MLKKKGLSTGLGDEGGFAPNLDSNRAALDLIAEAVAAAGFNARHRHRAGHGRRRVRVPRQDGSYAFEGGSKSSDEMTAYYAELVAPYPIVSIEDPLDEDDWDGWKAITEPLGDRIQIVGDDLFVTNVERLQRGIDGGQANALLVKVNQIGSLTETLDSVDLAHRNGFRCMMSHRSGETEDTTIADLAVATNCGQIKTGAPARSDRVAKYNQLLRIEDELGDAARYAGAGAFPRYQGLSGAGRRWPQPAARRARPAGRAAARGARPAAARRPRPAAARTGRGRGRRRRPAAVAGSRLTGRAAVLVLVLSVLTVSYASSLRAYLQQRSTSPTSRPRSRSARPTSTTLEREKRRWQRPGVRRASRPARASAT